jgi:predicted AAA+ superfamily ATPase
LQESGQYDRMYDRVLDLAAILRHRSLFLLGARQTGKSTLVHRLFPEAAFFDLLEADTFRELSARPEYMRQTVPSGVKLVVIDEVQKLPRLLDEVHLMIERDKALRFLLLGSSARKLKRGGANLLAGRAWTAHLHPLVFAEVGRGRLLERLNRGSLPVMIDSELAHEDLKAYVGTYLQEEIRAEGLTRSIENFSRFLTVAATCNGELLNYTAVGSDAGVPPRTVREYFQILEDTLLGYQLPAFRKTVKRKPIATSKFYFFDVGIANTLLRRSAVVPGSETFGRALEHLVFLELRAKLDYTRMDLPLTYWRTRSRVEVDFVLGDRIAIEVKGKPRVTRRDQAGLRALAEELRLQRKIVVCTETRRRRDDDIEILPVEEFLADLWSGEIL